MFPAWNPFDPVGSLSELVLSALNEMTKLFQSTIAHPPRVSNNASLIDRYAASLQTGSYLAYMVLVFVITLTLALFRKGDRIIKALIVSLVFGAFAPSFLYIVDLMTSTGDDWSTAASQLFSGTASVPAFGNPILDIPAAILALFLGSVVTAYIVSYDLLIIIFKMVFPLAYASSSYGKRAMQFLNVLISLGLVATLFGRPLAVLIMGMGQLAVQTFPGGNVPFIASIYSDISYLLAGLSQLVLTVALYKAVKEIEGRISSAVTGAVKSSITNSPTVNVLKAKTNQRAGVQPVIPVPVPMARGVVRDAKAMAAQTARTAASRRVLHKTIQVGSKGVAAAAAALGQPKAALVINKAGGKFAKRFK
jgi:hypothetical protein